MRFRPTALGYLRSDVSGIQQAWDEAAIRRLAERLGYDLAEIIILRSSASSPLQRLKRRATALAAEAVIVPGVGHFDGEQVPADLVQRMDVITISPECTYARWATGFVDIAEPRR
ncbi:hypothetical protein [Nocardia yamanashiensis]|uniref:hypothetical protein n=1 Tax=Nocardia yamanashiensis TaxID=209247 RepID=UPI00082EFC57|nr:hypothetical protein [Nocardia yamanashiensis]